MVIDRRHAMGTLAALFELVGRSAHGQAPQTAVSRQPPVFRHDLPNITLDNWEITVAHVDYPPGYVGKPHQHRGLLFAYVLEGEVVSQIIGDGAPADERTYKAGEMFYEPIGSTHQAARNTSAISPARLLIFNLAEKAKTVVAILLAVIAMSAGLRAEPQSATQLTPDGAGVGPQVGETIPDFTLPDGSGRMHTRASLIGPKGATIVFFRSADWCPPCKAHLIEMQGHLDRLRRDGLTVLAISRDSQDILAEFAKRYGITFPLLSDADSTTIKRFGVLDANGWVGTPRFGVPYRGTITVNHDGVVTSTIFQKTWQEHTTMASVLIRMGKGIDVPATKISAPYLRLTSFTSDRTVTPGAHFMTVLDLVPASGIHVYAPGATQYLPLKLTITPRPGLIVKNVQLPTGEDYYYKPLNEHVPVYQRAFRVTQELMVDPSPEGQKALRGATSITVEGTLEYQACSDKECYPPQRLPLTWPVNIGALDETRITSSQ